MGCSILVGPSLQVGEHALYLVFRHSAQSYLVGHEDEGGVLCREAVELLLEGVERLLHVRLALHEEVGAPQSDAVYHCHTACDVVPAQLYLLFYVCPFGTSVLLVALHTFAELVVPDLCRCHIHRSVGELVCQLLGIRAFARALSSCH